ncbi:hypothetical protein ACJX0J_042156, partial [Zea mays]
IIGIQETIKQDFSNKELRSLDGDNKFLWKWLPAKGHSGGILMGVKGDSLEVEDWECFTYAINAVIKDRVSNFRWCVITVYGPANHQFSKEFLDELSDICRNEVLPIIIGGDFNLIREPGFEELVKEKWIEKVRKQPVGIYSIEGWHGSLTALRMFLKGWHRRLIGYKNKEKNDLIQELDQIDILIEDQVFWQQRAGRKWTAIDQMHNEGFDHDKQVILGSIGPFLMTNYENEKLKGENDLYAVFSNWLREQHSLLKYNLMLDWPVFRYVRLLYGFSGGSVLFSGGHG